MNREEELQSDIEAFLEPIAFAFSELNNAEQLIALRANKLVDYMQTIDPDLNRVEATHLASAVIQGLPEHFKHNPELLTELKVIAQEMRNSRPEVS